MPAIGIDLGTTYSCVAVSRNGKVEVIANLDRGNRITPSCVAFTDVERLIGEAAIKQMSRNSQNTIYDVKRMIGRKYDDTTVIADMKNWGFKVSNIDGKPMINVRYKGEDVTFRPEEISAMVLSRMKLTAEEYVGEPIHSAVITVPAHFNDNQRRATADAAKIAGIHVLRMVNEPTAAAIAYGIQNKTKKKRNIVVFDLGGGTFDVTVLCIQDKKFWIQSTAGDTHLGGQDFNERLFRHLAREFTENHNNFLTNDTKATHRLRAECENAKIGLSSGYTASIELDALYMGQDFDAKVSRAQFEQQNEELFNESKMKLDEALKDAGMDHRNIDEVVLVGGSTRIPYIQEMLATYFGSNKISKKINPDEAVACGAAYLAELLSGSGSSMEAPIQLLDVTSLSLGIETKGAVMTTVVKRNTTIPITAHHNFTTTYDNQTSATVSVYEGERGDISHNTLLGSFTLNGIAPAPAGKAKLKICFDINASGVVTVSAKDEATNMANEISISQNRGCLDDDEIKRLVKEGKKHQDDDEKWKQRVRALNDLEALVHRAKKLIQTRRVQNMTGYGELRRRCDEIAAWLDKKRGAPTKEFLQKKEELENLIQPYQ